MPNRPMRFVSLHSHSTFSSGDGYELPKVHVTRIVELGMKALALSEHGNVSSWVDLEQAAEKAGVQPIFAIEIYFGRPKVRAKTHMVLIAMNEVGLQNINRIVTRSWQQFYYSPTVYWKDLVEFNEGIIALSGCADSALSCELLGGKWFGPKTLEPEDGAYERAVRGVRRFQQVFGDRYYLEVQRFPGLERTCALNPLLAQISRDTGVPLVATADVHYPYPHQNEIQRILHAADRGKDVETTDASWEYDILLTYPLSDREILNDLVGTGLSLDEAKESVLNTERITDRCKGVRLPKAPPPRFKPDEHHDFVGDPKKLLSEWITLGWNYRLKHNKHMRENKAAYKERMKHEYETICAREGFADYFLIVSDLITWAKSQGIAVGPGRGSAAGSLVCYLLQITEIDSMQFPMLFERFLDPTRTDPPDIDIDFEDERRDEVFQYAARVYGSDYVANILNFTRYKGNSALDDIGKVYHLPKWKIDAVKSKLLERPEGHPRFDKSIEDTYNTFPEIRQLVEDTPELAFAPRLEGNLQGFNVHAAGMAIGSVPTNFVSATYEREINGVIRQGIAYDKRGAAYLGMLKFDILSLITMGEIAGICKMAGMKLEDLYRVPLDDNETLQAFRDGDIMGIFQFEGVTTRRILKAVQPTRFMHLADVNALARPGADDKGYIRNKNSGELPDFAHPIIKQHTTVWPNTYGVITYEEQILMILRDLGGFAPAELNRMRKIIHDKLGSTAFNEYFQRFLKGCAAQGLSEDTAREVWDGMVSASGYAFNIAHSVSYAHIGYWQQFLKIHHPAEFYAKKLTKCPTSPEGVIRRGKFIQEAGRHGIDVEPPRLLESGHDWTLIPEKKLIVAGMASVHGIGPKTVDKIIDWRNENADRDLKWDDLLEISGIGVKKIAMITNFVYADDPFGVQRVPRVLNRIRNQIKRGEFSGVPEPDTISIDIDPTSEEQVCYIGIVRQRKYYDAVEQLQKKSKEDLSYEDALAQIDDPHLLTYVALDVEDEYGEIVRVWLWRNKFQPFANAVDKIKLNRDVVIARGRPSEFGGISISANQFVVINPESE
ncbi:DNA polymerase [Mycobacterium phage Indlulamithi]|uniref:DNA-directed DNA polymerase n=1 Tax=Mycobacterium phage Indlulamithi TaxID=2656582 RepID=A0A649VD25_9CAUD|nr:DNA polymerase [Mycobacterium phage Indlulamithi]QGJ90114.1 DnaE-like DNA polymerase III [Mycobacterium phage Indlulamithi]